MHGYSSSEESEDPRRPRVPATTNSNKDDQKKKRKKKPPPQKSINKIWKKFSKREFQKALAVLPFDPVLPPALSVQSNELLSAGYDRAAEECQRKVNKIIKECKRVNMRYRDLGFDLDWDLKYKKGHCLNSLNDKRFELNGDTVLSSVPKDVKRVHEIFENPTFMKHVGGDDIKQGSVGDCWLIAGLTAMANVEDGLRRICVAYDTKIGIYGFVFYRDGEWIYSIIDDKLYLKSPCWDSPSAQRELLQQNDREDPETVYRKTYQTGSQALFFAHCRDQNETWLPLVEKAYAKAHGDYSSLAGGWIGEGVQDLSGGVTTELFSSDILDKDEFWDKEMSRVNQEFAFGASTGLLEHGYGHREGITEGHAYVVMEAKTLSSGQRMVKMRNPWGKIAEGVWTGAWGDGSKEWTREAQEELDHRFGNDSVFWISYENLIQKYTHFDRTRLFRDPDWRCCQRWIGVDVPWKAQYHEKFQIKLSQDSPLVLVLSQLDGRYFKGLRGQYTFRLHFRLHDADRPQAEDYIVRSHGNYLMERSVMVELPDMPAGRYVVYLMVTGERDSNASSVEQIVKTECTKRVANDKLAQVGYAYDLAHSKAWDHMEKVAQLRQKKNQKKASRCRQDERRRQWQKRKVTREINEKQSKKNSEKRTQRRAEWEAEQARLDKEFEIKAREERDLKIKAKVAAAKAKAEDKAKTQAEAAKVETDSSEKLAETMDTLSVEQAKDSDKPEAEGDASSSSSGSPQFTPKTENSMPDDVVDKQDVPPLSGPPSDTTPSVEEEEPLPTRTRPAYDSTGESSDSPVEDWEALYSSDDMTRKPQVSQAKEIPVAEDYDTEEEEMPDPWNAICIVGVRVYSKDKNLELRTVLEGGELLEDGMGEKGAVDLDNAQANAGGVRADGAAAEGSSLPVAAADGGDAGQGKTLIVDGRQDQNSGYTNWVDLH